jgi:hypothetical protein
MRFKDTACTAYHLDIRTRAGLQISRGYLVRKGLYVGILEDGITSNLLVRKCGASVNYKYAGTGKTAVELAEFLFLENSRGFCYGLIR